jgi:hypothetical protein
MISKFLKKLISPDGEVSSKRIVGIFGFLVLCSALVMNAQNPKEINPSPELIDAIEYVVIACFLGTSIDRFATKPEKDANH